VPPPTIRVSLPVTRVLSLSTDYQGATNLVAPKQKKLSLREVLIMEAIDLNVWIFMPAPWWVPTVMVYDND
jgi:hypothetical protein